MTSLSNTSPSSALTDAPFQADTPNADVVLRSSDGGMFFVHKIILQYASPVFKDMLSIPQPSRPAHEEDTDSESGLPVIRLTEESETVERILRLSYPVAEPAFRDVADTVKMLEAAEKYQMHLVVTRMEHPVYAFVDSEPLAAYAIACRYTFRDVARAAAVRVRKAVVAAGSSQTHRPQLDYIPEMDHMSASALHRLLHFCYDLEITDFQFTLNMKPSPAVDSQSEELLEPLLSHMFDHHFQDSDIILRTSDGARFYAHSTLLRLFSPTLWEIVYDRFNFIASDVWSVVSVDETRCRLGLVLYFCYSTPDPAPANFAALERALGPMVDIARKYKVARLTDFVRRTLRRLAAAAPLRAYMIAAREGWEEEAQYAARHAVYQPVDPHIPEMEHASARAYHRLLTYRCACLRTIASLSRRQTSVYESYTLAFKMSSWHACSTYVVRPPTDGAMVYEYDTAQARWAMLSVVDGTCAGAAAPFAVAGSYQGKPPMQNSTFVSALQEGDRRTAEFRKRLDAVKF